MQCWRSIKLDSHRSERLAFIQLSRFGSIVVVQTISLHHTSLLQNLYGVARMLPTRMSTLPGRGMASPNLWYLRRPPDRIPGRKKSLLNRLGKTGCVLASNQKRTWEHESAIDSYPSTTGSVAGNRNAVGKTKNFGEAAGGYS